MRESAAISTVVSGCLIKWRVPGKVMNIGYIEYWAKKNLAAWDQSIERRAGGLDNAIDYATLHLNVRNSSSLGAGNGSSAIPGQR